jgi:hypothetical protein
MPKAAAKKTTKKAAPKKATPKKRAASKKAAKPAPAEPVAGGPEQGSTPRLLTHAEQYYVQAHREAKTVAELAAELSLPAESVQGFIDHLEREDAPENRPLRRLTDNMNFKPGTYFMTEAMSEIGDAAVRGSLPVSQAEIDEAVAARDYERAARLQKQLKSSRAPAAPGPVLEPHILVIDPKRPVQA